MIIIRMSGGLERQMFQYALYLKLTAMGREVKFDDINEYRDEKAKPIMLSVFGLTYPRATWDEINVFTDGSTKMWDRLRKILGGRRTNIYREKGYFDPQVLAMEEGYLDGTFQSEKYFGDIREEVRKAFQFSDLADMHLPQPIYDSTVELLGRITETNAVGIHIRRSDSRPNEELYENICTPEYYRAAVNYIQERYPDATYYIFSNEPKWIKGWMKDLIKSQITEEMTREQIVAIRKKFVMVQTNTEYTSYLDLLLLESCKHNIISNSSFSWWGAWLNEYPDKIVIAPTPWMNNSQGEEIYTEGMVLINGKGKVEHRVK
ncbi:MAG: alpha-1,2-fucosyltransferase [Lachnospiraceae bacterium]|nr:alpha-1,2-fucosyltransferase [Lachnospiraceae bacterium]